MPIAPGGTPTTPGGTTGCGPGGPGAAKNYNMNMSIIQLTVSTNFSY